eukprot:706056_1
MRVLPRVLAVGVEAGQAFVEASERVQEMFGHHESELTKMSSFKRLGDFGAEEVRKSVADLLKEHERLKNLIQVALHAIERSYPRVIRAIETRHLSQYLLQMQRREVDKMLEEGTLEDREYMCLIETVDHSIHRQLLRPYAADELDSRSIVTQSDFLQEVDRKLKSKFIRSIKHMFVDPGEKLEPEDTKIYMVTRGELILSLETVPVGHIQCGGLFGLYGFLTGKKLPLEKM